jgi:hypothetical protein
MVKFPHFRAVVIGHEEFYSLGVTLETIPKPVMILPVKNAGVKFILVGIEIRWVYEKESAVRGTVYHLFEILAGQFDSPEFFRCADDVARPILRAHGILVTVAPETILHVHYAAVRYSIEIIPPTGPLHVVGGLEFIFVKTMEFFAGWQSVQKTDQFFRFIPDEPIDVNQFDVKIIESIFRHLRLGKKKWTRLRQRVRNSVRDAVYVRV